MGNFTEEEIFVLMYTGEENRDANKVTNVFSTLFKE